MLKGVMTKEGTGSRASMQGYSAAGKTGTCRGMIILEIEMAAVIGPYLDLYVHVVLMFLDTGKCCHTFYHLLPFLVSPFLVLPSLAANSGSFFTPIR